VAVDRCRWLPEQQDDEADDAQARRDQYKGEHDPATRDAGSRTTLGPAGALFLPLRLCVTGDAPVSHVELGAADAMR
jgi:hypothetical protein